MGKYVINRLVRNVFDYIPFIAQSNAQQIKAKHYPNPWVSRAMIRPHNRSIMTHFVGIATSKARSVKSCILLTGIEQMGPKLKIWNKLFFE